MIKHKLLFFFQILKSNSKKNIRQTLSFLQKRINEFSYWLYKKSRKYYKYFIKYIKNINASSNNDIKKKEIQKDKIKVSKKSVKKPDKPVKNEGNKHVNICTIVGIKYLIKAIALYNSLKEHTKSFTLYVCCVDESVFIFFNTVKFKNVVPIKLSYIENDELLQAKKNREMNEYCWTLKSWLLWYILAKYNVDSIIYCDSDIYFLIDSSHIIKDWGDSSIYLCPQRDLDWVERKYGIYQAGIVGFKNNITGKKAVNWWKYKCLEWCYHKEDYENNRFGDQKYLERMPKLFGDVKISGHLGINAAPWNTIYNNNYKISKINGNIYIESYPLVAYHYSCIDVFDKENFDIWNLSAIKVPENIVNYIYFPYMNAIRIAINIAQGVVGNNIRICLCNKKIEDSKTYLKYNEFKYKMSKWSKVYYICTLVSQDYIFKVLTFYNSLKDKMDNFHLWICCMDDRTFSVLNSMKLENANVFPVKVIESQQIKEAKKDRTMNEYCWTLKPILCKYLLARYNVDKILYCDSDIYFFSHPKEIYNQWIGHSIFMTRQRATRKMESTNGEYQAGLIGFSNDENSSLVLNWWAKNCIKWCYDKPEPDLKRWGDQKYLDEIPKLFGSIKVCTNYGINVGPWNLILNNETPMNLKIANGKILINNDELIVYHFGSLLILNKNEFDVWKFENLNIDYRIVQNIYIRYLKSLQKAINNMEQNGYNTNDLFKKEIDKNSAKNYIRVTEESSNE